MCEKVDDTKSPRQPLSENAFGRSLRLVSPLAMLMTILLIGGCTPWATYPPVAGSSGMHEPWLTPIPDVIAQAVRFAHFEDGRTDPIIFNLPEGTPPLVYERVIGRLAAGGNVDARPMRDPSEFAYHVTEVRVRTVESEVDLIHRNKQGKPEEMTVTVNRNLLSGFFVSDVRHWRYNVDMPPPHFRGGSVEMTSDWREGDRTPAVEDGDAASTEARANGWPYE